jgi:outer membrane protein OmpA-like peptidoglycan-associated protein
MMKPFCIFFLAFFLCIPLLSTAQQHELAPGYYVVVGAYAQGRENIAQNYVETLTRRGFKAEYGFNSSRNLYFVYLRYFDNLKESLKNMTETRRKSEFSDAWVRVVPGVVTRAQPTGASDTPATGATTRGEANNPNNPASTGSPAKKTESGASKAETPSNQTPAKNNPASSVAPAPAPSAADTIEVTDNPPIKQYNPVNLENTEVFVSLFHGRNNRIVDGEVKVIDTERARLINTVKGNEYISLPDPKSKSGQLTLIAEVFGYRKTQTEVNFPLPLRDTVKQEIDLMGTTIVINFDMIRYHRGDIVTMYNVYFYNDAAVMQPESKYELNSLLELMQENPKYKIVLHGHTNGNYHGRIIVMGESKNFFTLSGSKDTSGSAKELSGKRAEAIRDYLIANGIAADRIGVKAWGGRRPLYDKHSPNARKNVRVEVEITEE